MQSLDRDFDQPYSADELALNLLPDDYTESIVLMARDERGVVGGAWAGLPRQANRSFAFGDVFVVPGRRREGHGTALTEALMTACRDAGRTRMMLEARWGMVDEVAPARQLVEKLGFSLDHRLARRVHP